jgi:aminopeptidase N
VRPSAPAKIALDRAGARRQSPPVHRLSVVVSLLAACGGSSATPDAASLAPTPNATRGIADTKLAFDIGGLSATATLTFEPSMDAGATVEVGDLTIDAVTVDGMPIEFAVAAAKLDLGLRASDQPIPVTIAYHYKIHENFQGASARGFTLMWPYYCGNVFPCHSAPADGTTFTLDVTNVPAGKTAVFPTTIPTEAPSYQIAWSIDAYTEVPLGTTTAGTALSVWHRANEAAAATQGTTHLLAAFDWLEKTIGPYKFGPKAGTVSTNWGPGAFGGMEHHPYWHVGSVALGDIETNVHEAAHGWFGGGVRIQCWEDFVLSEGTVSYLAARALDVVAPTVGAATWTSYEQDLGTINGAAKVWPATCNSIDIIKDQLFTRAPYMRGAFFYRAVALKVGADKLDEALAAFYVANANKPATMASMLTTITQVTGYDPTTCAEMWLRSTTKPAVGPCP